MLKKLMGIFKKEDDTPIPDHAAPHPGSEGYVPASASAPAPQVTYTARATIELESSSRVLEDVPAPPELERFASEQSYYIKKDMDMYDLLDWMLHQGRDRSPETFAALLVLIAAWEKDGKWHLGDYDAMVRTAEEWMKDPTFQRSLARTSTPGAYDIRENLFLKKTTAVGRTISEYVKSEY